MGFLIGLLTVFMVFDCIILVFLVLIQLPKKEAGAGLAFGASATDALFGAGSGTVLTKITKYAAGAFFALAIILSLLRSNYFYRGTRGFQQNLTQPPAANTMPPTPAAPPSKAESPQPVPNGLQGTSVFTTSGVPGISGPAVEATNTSAPAASTNAAPK